MRAIGRALIMTFVFCLLHGHTAADAQASRRSWLSDRRDFAPGDLLTVLIDEHTLAALNQGDFASARSIRDVGFEAAQNVTGSYPITRAEVGTFNQAESRRGGQSTRQNRFQGEMTVRIISIEEGGALRVEGRKALDLDRASEELVLSGLVRPQDVRGANLVDSWRIADAELIYSSRPLSPRTGLLGRLLDLIWP